MNQDIKSHLQENQVGLILLPEQIRNVILDKKNTKMDARTEALLYAQQEDNIL